MQITLEIDDVTASLLAALSDCASVEDVIDSLIGSAPQVLARKICRRLTWARKTLGWATSTAYMTWCGRGVSHKTASAPALPRSSYRW